ncbi:FUSC family protein [Herbiconiux sp. CPCC 205716]|uniref:FUSC family protein n=1 Tax=Herbiconiux gentiana TaxID=2970912 RepID=A0ABT2GD26_9MICO|nr:FUSC family protein [Herbiconiux gentiana]MCS5714127.1 FUSC family protein [Herbiconiux gentiana]
MAVPLLTLYAVGRIDLSLYAVFGAFTALYGRSHTHFTRLRMQAAAAVALIGVVVLGTAIAVSPEREWLVVPVVAVVAAGLAFVADALDWHPPGALFFVFALAACASVPAEPSRVVVALGLATASALFAMVVSTIGVVRPSARMRPATDLAVSFRAVAARPGQARKIVTIGAAVLLAGAIPTATGLGHPYWAMVAAVAALGAADTAGHLVRGVQRVLGTLLGVGVAAVLLAIASPQTLGAASTLALVLIVVLLQVAAELFIGRNYAVTVVFVTPLALIMAQLAHPVDELGMLRDRTVETLLGAVVAIALSLAATLVAWRRSAAG